jgi:hypothetical protein
MLDGRSGLLSAEAGAPRDIRPTGPNPLDPRWVRAATVGYGQQRSPTVTTVPSNRRPSAFQLKQQGRYERAIRIVVPEVGVRVS